MANALHAKLIYLGKNLLTNVHTSPKIKWYYVRYEVKAFVIHVEYSFLWTSSCTLERSFTVKMYVYIRGQFVVSL